MKPTPTSDGNSGQFCALHGDTYNCPAEVAEARCGVTADYLSFHDEDGGAGFHRGGKGVRIDYRSPTTLRQPFDGAQDTAPG